MHYVEQRGIDLENPEIGRNIKNWKWFNLSDCKLQNVYNGTFKLTEDYILGNLWPWYPDEEHTELSFEPYE